MPSPYTTFSALGRVKRVVRRLDQANKIYEEVVAESDKLKTSKEGEAILKYTKTEMLTAWRAKTRVRKIRVGLRQDGWFKSKIAPVWKDDTPLYTAESEAKIFFLDAVNTSAKAAELLTMSPENGKDDKTAAEGSEASALYSAVCALQTHFEEEEDEEDDDGDTLLGETSFIASETDSLS